MMKPVRSVTISFRIIIFICTVVTHAEKCSTKESYNSMGLIAAAGYAGEEHRVQTADGYVLTLHRIVAPPAPGPQRQRPLPVILQHGLWSSSYYWLSPGRGHALPFLLSDAGLDVWMSNSRGNVISREHISLSIDSEKFWDFSFHEMGIYDLPAVFDYVLNTTAKPKVQYIGHSMGTTMFFVMASLRPDLAAKVHFMVALAPIATVGPIENFMQGMKLIQRTLLGYEFPHHADILISKHTRKLLSQFGMSVRTILHLMQLYRTGTFTMFDYGEKTNVQKYNSTLPPSYKITTITVPVLLCYGKEDPFSTLEDAENLRSSLGGVVYVLALPLSHLEFSGGKNTKRLLFDQLILNL